MRDPEKLFADAIIGWHEACGRHDLPWQVEDWYPRLVSEVMLQQTQVGCELGSGFCDTGERCERLRVDLAGVGLAGDRNHA